MTEIHFFDFSTHFRENDFVISAHQEFEGPLALLRYFARTETLEWDFGFDYATPEEMYLWTEADLIVKAERAFSQGKMVFFEGHVMNHEDFFRALALFRGVFGSLPTILHDDIESLFLGTPIIDKSRHYQFVAKLLGAPV